MAWKTIDSVECVGREGDTTTFIVASLLSDGQQWKLLLQGHAKGARVSQWTFWTAADGPNEAADAIIVALNRLAPSYMHTLLKDSVAQLAADVNDLLREQRENDLVDGRVEW